MLANSTTVLSIASFAPTVSTLTIQVQTSGAKLAAWIQHRVMNGTESLGVDLVYPSLAPQLESVIPGFVVRGTEAINQVAVTEGIADAGHSVRVFAPTGASVTIQIVSTSAEVFGAVVVPAVGVVDGDEAEAVLAFVGGDDAAAAESRELILERAGRDAGRASQFGDGRRLTVMRAAGGEGADQASVQTWISQHGEDFF